MFASKKLLAAAALVFIGMSNASANLIANGDFETGNFNGWTSFTTNNGQTGAQVSTGPNGTNAASFHVGQLAYDGTEQGGGIRQSIMTGDGAITITADIGVSSEGDGSDMVNMEGGVFQLMLDSLIIDTVAFGFLAGEDTQTGVLSYSGVVSAGVHEISFLVTRPYIVETWTPWQFIDNVFVDAAAFVNPPAQVPEPATGLLLASGLSALFLNRRRRKAASD